MANAQGQDTDVNEHTDTLPASQRSGAAGNGRSTETKTGDSSSGQAKEPAVGARLLVGVDAHSKDTQALTEAFAFATLIARTRLDVVWVPPYPPASAPALASAYPVDAPPADPLQLLKDKVLDTLDEEWRSNMVHAGATMRLHIGEGPAAQALNELAFLLESDLMIVGAHDKGKIESFLMGSTSAKLIKSAPCPVLVARPKIKEAVPQIEAPAETTGHRTTGLPHRYHQVPRNVSAQENMPLVFPMNS